jgi:hypothetical protein
MGRIPEIILNNITYKHLNNDLIVNQKNIIILLRYIKIADYLLNKAFIL